MNPVNREQWLFPFSQTILNCEMTYASKAVIKRKPFPIEEYWHEAHSARKFIGWRWGMGKGNEQGVLEADLINVVDRKGECVQHNSRA